jgi:hypothetical protein
MLNVERANHVNAGVQQLQNILIPLLVAAKWSVRMRQLIDNCHLRVSPKDCIEVHLLNRNALVLDPLAGNHFESLDQHRRIRSPVSLNESQDNIDPALL